MKRQLALGLVASALTMGSAMAAITVDGTVDAGYGAALATDPTTAWTVAGDEGGAGGNAVIDLGSLFVTNGGSNLYVAFTIDGDVTATDWGKYCINITSPNITITGGPKADQWGRAVTLGTNTNYQFHSWVDGGGGGGFAKWNNTGSTWDASTGTSFVFDGGQVPSVVEISIPLSELGSPTVGQQVGVIAWVTGGGSTDNAQDQIGSANVNASDWSTATSLAGEVNYTIVAPSEVADWNMY